MKAIHLTAYGDPAQNLLMVEVSEPNGRQRAGGREMPVFVSVTRQDQSDSSRNIMTENSFILKIAGQAAWSASRD